MTVTYPHRFSQKKKQIEEMHAYELPIAVSAFCQLLARCGSSQTIGFGPESWQLQHLS